MFEYERSVVKPPDVSGAQPGLRRQCLAMHAYGGLSRAGVSK
jgi:hypothetical protein